MYCHFDAKNSLLVFFQKGSFYIAEFYLQGIHPFGGKIDQSLICDCGAATGKLRKELEVHVAWEDDMWKPDSDSFKEVKQKIEAQVCSFSIVR